jgi:hypothetical protein
VYYGFDTKTEDAGIAALLVYGVYRSRDMKRFKITPDMWGIIERAAKSSAKRALDLHDFIEKLKPKLSCSSLKPRWMKTESKYLMTMVENADGSFSQIADQGRRKFWVEILEEIDHEPVLAILRDKTAWVIALVRDRLERERPLEVEGLVKDEEEGP